MGPGARRGLALGECGARRAGRHVAGLVGQLSRSIDMLSLFKLSIRSWEHITLASHPMALTNSHPVFRFLLRPCYRSSTIHF